MSVIYLIAGLISALVSGMTGLAGGVLLLSVLTVSLPLEAVVPLHALIQVIANLSRVLLLRQHIEWRIWRAFNLLALPAGIAGVYCVTAFPKDLTRGLIGFVITLAAVYMLTPSRPKSKMTTHSARYVLLGAISSLLGMVVGATGPLIAPFFIIGGLSRERFIATKSACQLTVQVIKTILFAQLLNFAYAKYTSSIILITTGVLLGTWVARRLLARIQGVWLEKLTALLLIVLGTRLIISALP